VSSREQKPNEPSALVLRAPGATLEATWERIEVKQRRVPCVIAVGAKRR
jgi:hypothetical protein